VHRVGEKAENQVFWLDFCAKKELWIHPQGMLCSGEYVPGLY
jgi:hypothetical protein